MSEENIYSSLVSEGALHRVACVNWKEYPYSPQVDFNIARSDRYLAVLFHVTEDHVRATAMEPNGPVWEDSCVETFITAPDGKEYFNFEVNCIGTVLASRRKSRTEAEHFGPELMSQIRCFGSLPHEVIDSEREGQKWWRCILIPLHLTGHESWPESLRANFYKCRDKCRQPHFLSWSEIDLPAPDFHCPEFFGELRIY